MILRELLDTLKCLGATLTLHDGDTISIEPPDVVTPAVRVALSEHHAALVALIRSGPASPSSFDTLLTAFDGVDAHPSAEILQERLRILAAGLAGADPLVRELVRAEAIARLDALGVRAAARLVDAALTARLGDSGRTAPGQSLLFADPDPWPAAVEGTALLDELAHTYRRFVSLPEGGAEALALWIVFTYALEAFDVAPILALCSPLKRCPLLAIADEARGGWPELARTAARTLAGAVVEADTTAPVRLLADLRDLFATTAADRLATATIIRHLTALEDRPWADDAQGRPLTPRHLATLLEGFRIKAKQIRQGADTRKGYLRSDFTDAFRRYLPPDPKHPKHCNSTTALI